MATKETGATALPTERMPERRADMREINNGYIVLLDSYGTQPLHQELAFTSVNKAAALRKALRILAAFFDADVE